MSPLKIKQQSAQAAVSLLCNREQNLPEPQFSPGIKAIPVVWGSHEKPTWGKLLAILSLYVNIWEWFTVNVISRFLSSNGT